MAALTRNPILVRVLAVALIAAVVAAGVLVYLQASTRSGTAYFATVKNIYPKDRVRITGLS